MTQKALIKIAKKEIEAWSGSKSNLPPGLVLSILFCFVHRITTGETVEETFFRHQPTADDYQI